MPIEFRCTKCDRTQRVPDYTGGTQFKCECGQLLTVPGGKSEVNVLTIAMIAVVIVTVPILFYMLVLMEEEPPRSAIEETEEATVSEVAPADTATEEPESPATEEAPAGPSAKLSLAAVRDLGPKPRQAISPNAQRRITEGDASFARGQYNVASAAYEEALAIDGASLPARLRLAAILFNTGKVDEAKAEAQGLIKKDTDAVTPQYLLACIYRATGAHMDAHRQLQLCIDLAPAELSLRSELVDLLRETGDEEGAINCRYEAVSKGREQAKTDPADADTQFFLGKMLCELGNYDEAEKHLQSAQGLKHPQAAAWMKRLEDARRANAKPAQGDSPTTKTEKK